VASFVIRYEFLLEGGERRVFTVELDETTLLNRAPLPADPPRWAKLEYHQCPACPLSPEKSPYCPTAAHLAELVSGFSATTSHQQAFVRVQLPEREVAKQTSVQLGLSSLLGVHMTTSGCPVLARLRPMVRFHLPFATREETIFRSLASYLVGQYLKMKAGGQPDWTLAGLVETYDEVAQVNRAFAKRLRHAVERDAGVNALVRLDVLGRSLPDSIDDGLADLRPFFDAVEPQSSPHGAQSPPDPRKPPRE
jgi:hypothetical protein